MHSTSTPEQLKKLSQTLLKAAPCALEMPAGTGKTHLIASTVLEAVASKRRCLILTHTNAGVDALKKRLSKFGVSHSDYRVDTITGFAFSLVRAYKNISGVVVPDIPEWSDSELYISGANKVVESIAIQKVLSSSFDYFFIDEYQDCNISQHEFILTISRSLCNTIILGDRLQGIFGFRGELLVNWDVDVFRHFPLLEVEHIPHRWRDTNPTLGKWLYDIRGCMKDGQAIDLGSINIKGFKWVQPEINSLGNVAYSFNDYNETVVLLDKWPTAIANHASRLGGSYSVMEDIRGNFMIEQLECLPEYESNYLSIWLAKFAKKCMIGLSGINAPVLKKLELNESISHYHRDDIQDVIIKLDYLRQKPSSEVLLATAEFIEQHSHTKIYRWEAWKDTLSAINNSILTKNSPVYELSVIRDKIRHSGRRTYARIASRTLLVKGLEYDHVIIADLVNMLDPKNLYVALTRAKRSITVISSSRYIVLRSE